MLVLANVFQFCCHFGSELTHLLENSIRQLFEVPHLLPLDITQHPEVILGCSLLNHYHIITLGCQHYCWKGAFGK